MNDFIKIEKIELYLENKLLGNDLNKFEEQLMKDDDIVNQLVNFTTAIKEIQTYSREELNNKLKHIHKEVIPEVNLKAPGVNRYMKVAVVFLGLLFLSSPFIYNNFFKQNSCEQLFSEYFEPYTNVTTQRSNVLEEIDLLKQSAMYFYEKKEYDKAIINFDELIKKGDFNDVDILFYYGVSCLGGGYYNKAIKVLDGIAEHEESVFYEQSNWYLALAYLKNNNKDKTSELLEKLISFEGGYEENAQDLFDELNTVEKINIY